MTLEPQKNVIARLAEMAGETGLKAGVLEAGGLSIPRFTVAFTDEA